MLDVEPETDSPGGSLRARQLTAARQNDATRYVALAKSLAQPFKLADWNERDEYESAALAGLVGAALSHNPSKRTAFGSYARRKIRCALLDCRRALARTARPLPVRGWDGPRCERPVGAELEASDFTEWCLHHLGEPHYAVCRSIYMEGRNQKETARALGLSESWVSELHAEALGILLDLMTRKRLSKTL